MEAKRGSTQTKQLPHKRKPTPSNAVIQEIDSYVNPHDHVPLAGYAELMAVYVGVFTSLHLLATRGGRKLEKPRGLDLALLAVASYKLSRVVTMSFIGSPLRAPFSKRGKSLRGGEVQDRAKGDGLQRAIGNLVTCPFCFSVWSSTLFMYGFSIAPQVTRQAAYTLSSAAFGDLLHFGYRNLREVSR